MDMAYTKEDLANIFEVVNQKLQLKGVKKAETKRSFKSVWKHDLLSYRLMVGWYNEITNDKDDSEIHDFVKKLNDKDKENRELKKTLDSSLKQTTNRYESMIQSRDTKIKQLEDESRELQCVVDMQNKELKDIKDKLKEILCL
tara:strand:- start:2199 stop:2627 length:429 start_codon:yes stop_codon:yes gene_type:complete